MLGAVMDSRRASVNTFASDIPTHEHGDSAETLDVNDHDHHHHAALIRPNEPALPLTAQNVSQPPVHGDLPLRGPRVERPKPLRWQDVAALIVNKMVGTGIFTGPFTVLANTNDRATAVGLWVLGFLYTLASMFVYLGFAQDLPYSGGELIYLDELFASPRLKFFDLFAYTLYANYFVLMYNTANNSMQFAWQVWMATVPADDIKPDQRVLRMIAVAITTLISCLLYSSSSKSRWLNRWTAYGKMGLLVAVIIAGGIYQRKHRNQANSGAFEAAAPRYGWASALLGVLFSFNGWDNATLVTGEVTSYRTLRTGFIAGVTAVGVAYLIIISIVCSIYVWPKDLEDSSPRFNYMAEYFGDSSATAKQAAAVLTALSAFGSMIGVTYTSVEVNRAIGWSNVLPFSQIWRMSTGPRLSWLLQNLGEGRIPQGTPLGGIVLHWLVTVVWISASSAYPDYSTAANFTGGIFVYARCFFSAAVGIGYLWFRHNPQKRPTPERWLHDKRPNIPPWLRTMMHWLLGSSTAAFSIAVIVCAPQAKDNLPYLYVTVAVLGCAILYWLFFVNASLANHTFSVAGLEVELAQHINCEPMSAERFCEDCESCSGGEVHRHAPDGYKTFTRMWVRGDSGAGRWFMKFLGGPDTQSYKPIAVDEQPLQDMSGQANGHVSRPV